MRTGATNEQLEAAAKSYFELDSPLFPRLTWESVREPYRERRRENVARIANHLVPPDHRIVSVDDLEALSTGYDGAGYTDEALVTRIRTLIGGS